MKKIFCLVISTALLLSLCACGSNVTSSDNEIVYEEEIIYDGNSSTTSDTQSVDGDVSQPTSSSEQTQSNVSSNTSSQVTQTQESIYNLNDMNTLKNIKLNGRCETTSNGINLNMAASAIEFNTDSTSVLLEVNASKGLYYTIMVDGQITEQHVAIETSGPNYIVVVRGLKGDSHNIKFIRDSESRNDLKFTVLSVQLDDGKKILPKDGEKPIIEFLGDSITSGFGNMVLNGVSNAGSLEYLSATKAYPFLVANELGYDYRIVSLSSIALGVREGYPAFYDFYSLENYHVDKTQKYTSSNPQDVDIVVVNLGTNDVSTKMYTTDNAGEYAQKFANLITDIGYKKDVKIVFLYGVWHQEPITAITKAITELNSRGYNDVCALQLSQSKSGGGSHPSADEHKQMAEKIVNLLKK